MNWQTVRRWRPSRIGLRLLAFNLLVVFVPVGGVLYLNVYESQLLQEQERAMVQQARLLAAALGESPALDQALVERIFARLERRSEARYRVYDSAPVLLADSGRFAVASPLEESAAYSGTAPPSNVRQRILYRLGAFIANARRSVRSRLRWAAARDVDRNIAEAPAAEASELRAALAGRYGATTRNSPGQRSVTLFSAVPIEHHGRIIGAVVVSQSTFRMLQALYEIRLRIFEIVVGSLVAAAVLTALATTTIVRPLTRLRQQAMWLAERRGLLPAGFPHARRRDELGDLSRALAELTRRVNDHIQLLQSFAADVSHEFKNPLASIRSAAEMMATADSEADRQRFFHLMTRDVDRLERLMTGLREVASIEGRIERDVTELVDLDALIREVIAGMTAVEPARVAVVLRSHDGRCTVRASRDPLTQVFENIVSNATSLAPHGSTVEIDLRLSGGACAITISDRGPGIPDTHLTRIFDRFFSYRPGEPSRVHLGLGLAIARQIVESYGGGIAAANRDGGGARFEVRLPSALIETQP
jgi:two-component system, OmpR family, sensor histidine kinase ChvG